MATDQEKVDGYLATVARLEPELHMVDRDAALASIAISLKRIADALDPTAAQHRSNANIPDMLWTLSEAVSSWTGKNP